MITIGVDESGTGAWAGPYTVCAVAAYDSDGEALRKAGGRDSKKMTDIRRRAAIIPITDIALYGHCTVVPVVDIDARKKRAWSDAILASSRHVVELVLSRGIRVASIEIVIDGLPDATVLRSIAKELGIKVRFLTEAEDQVPAVGAASVIAKNTRNEAMRELHEKYPVYGWNKNYGYGTAAHLESIKQHGRCPEHRDLVIKGLI